MATLIGLETGTGRLLEVTICIAKRRIEQGCKLVYYVRNGMQVMLPAGATLEGRCDCKACVCKHTDGWDWQYEDERDESGEWDHYRWQKCNTCGCEMPEGGEYAKA